MRSECASAHVAGGTLLARARTMRKLSSWAPRFALSAGATAGIVAACYNEVPGPSGPLPLPTREVSPQGPRPGPITPTPITPAPTPITPAPTPSPPMPSAPPDAGPGTTSREIESRVIEMNARFGAAQDGDEDDIDDDEGEDEDDDALDAGIDSDADAGDGGVVDAAVTDAGVADVIDLPPLPDSDVPIEPPGLPH